MIIAVNTRFLLKGKLEGIGWFTYETVKRMALNHPEHEFLFLFDRPFDDSFVFAQNVTPVIVSPPARHPLLWYIWFEIMVPRVLKKYRADVFLSTDCFMSLKTKVPTVIVIHDLAFYHFPKHLSKLYYNYMKFFTAKFVKKAKKIVAVSEYTKQDIIKTYKICEEKINIVYNGANDVYKPLDYAQKQDVKIKYTDGCEYFVYAGSLHPRKNIVNLLKAFAFFKRHSRSNMKLVLVGRFAWKTEQIENTLSNHLYKQDIIHLDYMNANELCKIIGAAYCLTYVSLFEGFGIPILEAMQCGAPVIASNTSSMPEVGGDCVLYANPNSYEDIAEKMIQIFNDENLRNSLLKKGLEQSKKFDWNKSAEQLYEIIVSNK